MPAPVPSAAPPPAAAPAVRRTLRARWLLLALALPFGVALEALIVAPVRLAAQRC